MKIHKSAAVKGGGAPGAHPPESASERHLYLHLHKLFGFLNDYETTVEYIIIAKAYVLYMNIFKQYVLYENVSVVTNLYML